MLQINHFISGYPIIIESAEICPYVRFLEFVYYRLYSPVRPAARVVYVRKYCSIGLQVLSSVCVLARLHVHAVLEYVMQDNVQVEHVAD